MQDPDKASGEFESPKASRDADHPRLGSLCTGYGGLDMAVQHVLHARLTWVADNDRHVSALLAKHHSGVPNLGDIQRIAWPAVEPVDVMCAGFPCQDISFAGRGAGIAHCVGDA